jgi:hypothetical protein
MKHNLRNKLQNKATTKDWLQAPDKDGGDNFSSCILLFITMLSLFRLKLLMLRIVIKEGSIFFISCVLN